MWLRTSVDPSGLIENASNVGRLPHPDRRRLLTLYLDEGHKLQPGNHLGPNRIEVCLGYGGMGQVYKATDTRLHRTVAIKILPPELREDPQLHHRFEREARAIAALRHPHVCVVHDVGHEGGLDFLVMEHLDGESLAQRLAAGPLPLDQVLRYGTDLADALAAIHEHGLVHRDVKPANVMLTPNGATLLDFGTVRVQRPHGIGDVGTDTTLTSASTMVGLGAAGRIRPLEYSSHSVAVSQPGSRIDVGA